MEVLETKDNVRRSVGGRIRERRKALKISVDDLAEYCDVSPEHIRKIESGYRAPGIDVLVDICNRLHTSSNYFFQDLVNEVDEEVKVQWMLETANAHQKELMGQLCEIGMKLMNSNE